MSTRVLLKLSGESFADPELNFGISSDILKRIANEISQASSDGYQIGIVVGGGNFFRGVSESAKDMAQANADYMGMLATVINAIALKDALDTNGTQTRVQSAIDMTAVAEPYIRLRAIRHLEKGRVVIFAAGTGNPYFTTDTAASLRAAEIEAEIVLKSTRVEGIFDDDPELEIYEISSPLAPKKWGELESVTISYGYGIAVTPIQIMNLSMIKMDKKFTQAML